LHRWRRHLLIACVQDSVGCLVGIIVTIDRQQIEDFWSYTTSGDIAFFLLTDLFTDKDERSFTLPGVPDWDTIMADCNETAETRWRRYVQSHGIASLQRAWRTAWDRTKDNIVWDPVGCCFRVVKRAGVA
jgi:hypothetical protein